MKKISIGKLLKPFGVDGSLKFDVEDRFLADFMNSDVVFLNVHGEVLPYFIDQFSKTTPLTVRFEDVLSKEAARAISMSKVSLKATDVSIKESEKEVFSLTDLEGYSLYDRDNNIGEIEAILEYPQQIMAQLTIQECQVLIPLPDQFIKDIDSKEKVLYCILPEGIITAQIS